MPEISRFYGIVVRMYFGDHAPPHFHVEYGSANAVIAIDNLEVIAGRLPHRALGLVVEWGKLHQDELLEMWETAVDFQPIGRIDPLD